MGKKTTQHEGAVCHASRKDTLGPSEQFCALEPADGTCQFTANVSIPMLCCHCRRWNRRVRKRSA